MPQKIAIIGATSSIAQHCARIWAAQAAAQEMLLLGRNQKKLERIQADLQVRNPRLAVSVRITPLDGAENIRELIHGMCQPSPPDLVLIAHGALPDQQQAQNDLVHIEETFSINAISPVLFAEGFAHHMQGRGRGQIAIIGSVAGDRGRKSNYIYGAAKGMIERYAEGMQHRFAGQDIHITLIKPGPTRTPMTTTLEGIAAKSLADPQQVAQRMVRGIAKKSPVVYVPAKWTVIMSIIRNLPRFVFHRMDI